MDELINGRGLEQRGRYELKSVNLGMLNKVLGYTDDVNHAMAFKSGAERIGLIVEVLDGGPQI
jgi:hypothetical protein